MTENTATSKSKKKTAFIVIAAIIGILIIVGIVFMIHANSYVNKALKKYDNKILDGVSIENVSVAAMTKKMATDMIKNRKAMVAVSEIYNPSSRWPFS